MNFQNFLNLYIYDWTCMQLLNCMSLTNTTVLYLVDVPPSQVKVFSQIILNIFHHMVAW